MFFIVNIYFFSTAEVEKHQKWELTHQMSIVCHIPQKAILPIETTCPFAPALLWSVGNDYILPLLDGPNNRGAIFIVGHMSPLVFGDLTCIAQLAGQRRWVFLL